MLFAFIAVMLAPALMIFLERKPIRIGVWLAFSALGGALLLTYLGQSLIALLQLFVFSGFLSLYLIMSAASEEAHVDVRGRASFILSAALLIAMLFLPFVLSGGYAQTLASNDFVAAAAASLKGGYALAYAAVFLVFASAIGAMVVARKFSKVV